jgi:hypothetical protein
MTDVVTRVCNWGWCVEWIDPDTGLADSGFGPVGCPCDHVKGWQRTRPEGKPMPSLPMKVKGRHGSRVQRAQQRKRLPNYGPNSFFELLPPRSRMREAAES